MKPGIKSRHQLFVAKITEVRRTTIIDTAPDAFFGSDDASEPCVQGN